MVASDFVYAAATCSRVLRLQPALEHVQGGGCSEAYALREIMHQANPRNREQFCISHHQAGTLYVVQLLCFV